MVDRKTVLGIVGSPNPKGRTNQLVTSALRGASHAGAPIELIQLSEFVVSACKDCLPYICKDTQKCKFEDAAFEYLSQKILQCGALILGAPVYWWDTSGLVRYLMLKMFRVFAFSSPTDGLPALGIAIAGGSGNGLVSGLRPLYHFFQVMKMRAIEPVPATRFNFAEALQRSEALGGQIAAMAESRRPFDGRESLWELYDALPYLGLNRAGERRLLAALGAMKTAEDLGVEILSGLAKSNALAAAGQVRAALLESTRVYDAAIQAFDRKEKDTK